MTSSGILLTNIGPNLSPPFQIFDDAFVTLDSSTRRELFITPVKEILLLTGPLGRHSLAPAVQPP